ncbi:hypothetical protein HU200_009299 [Digitaria exilis]|uniref:BTB domain-containing protein n=1 Tax=Digitaria exilis TaxID=1010633 RepID=A0A835FL09_9POAL|nr:hypothetical protein HU200_009299 [Digitaria exilis]
MRDHEHVRYGPADVSFSTRQFRRSMLGGPRTWPKFTTTTVRASASVTVQNQMLRFIYTDELPRDEELGETSSSAANEVFHDLLAAPDMFHATWEFSRFAKRTDLESSSYIKDGHVTFMFVVIVLPGDEGEGPIALPSSDDIIGGDVSHIAVPPSDIGDNLGHLLDGGDGSDVSFDVAGETFHAHRAVLVARSPVFKAQLLGSMADASTDRITLHSIHPETFRFLLRFIYTDALQGGHDEELEGSSSSSKAMERLEDLLVAADMFQLDRLKLVCAQKLWERVSPDNVAAMLGFAETHGCPELKKRCIDFFVVEKNFRRVALTEGYMRLMQSFPSVIEEIRTRRMLDSGEGSDVAFSVGCETFPAHRAVLASRSPVFRAELLGPMAESTMPTITLLDMDPGVFSAMLRFMYTDSLPEDEDAGDDLHLLHGLAGGGGQLVCEQRMSEVVTAENVVRVHGCPELKRRCLEFLAMEDKNLEEAAMTPEVPAAEDQSARRGGSERRRVALLEKKKASTSSSFSAVSFYDRSASTAFDPFQIQKLEWLSRIRPGPLYTRAGDPQV